MKDAFDPIVAAFVVCSIIFFACCAVWFATAKKIERMPFGDLMILYSDKVVCAMRTAGYSEKEIKEGKIGPTELVERLYDRLRPFVRCPGCDE